MRLAGIALVALGTTASAEAPLKPAAHYAKLFVKGSEWTYDITWTTWDHEKLVEMQNKGIDTSKIPTARWPRHTDKHVLSCRVARVASFTSAVVAEITCDKEFMYVPVMGVFIANANGLYMGGAFPATEADLLKPADLGPALIAAAPRAARVEKKETDGKSIRAVRAENGGWCASDSLVGAYHGHTGTTSLCFARGAISSGTHDIGPELRDIKFRVR